MMYSRIKNITASFTALIFLFACRHQPGQQDDSNDNSKKENRTFIKPPASFSDTLKIDTKAAVFYYPDSLQFEKIKAGIDISVFDATMHEYAYQVDYNHNELNKNWPGIKIIEAVNVRYLLFIKVDKSSEIIDLDTKYDPYGLFIFDPQKKPIPLELTNAPSEIGFYFAK